MKVKKYTITIKCEDELQEMTISGIYLDKTIAYQIFMYLTKLYDQQHIPEEK